MKTMDATTEFRPSPGFLQPTPKTKGAAVGGTPNPIGRFRCRWSAPRSWTRPTWRIKLELIQSHMAQKPVLRGKVRCAFVEREVSVE